MQLKNGQLGRDTLQFYLHFSACVSDEGVVIEILDDGEQEGSIESPGYPYVVPEYSRCRWTIIAPDGNVGEQFNSSACPTRIRSKSVKLLIGVVAPLTIRH